MAACQRRQIQRQPPTGRGNTLATSATHGSSRGTVARQRPGAPHNITPKAPPKQQFHPCLHLEASCLASWRLAAVAAAAARPNSFWIPNIQSLSPHCCDLLQPRCRSTLPPRHQSPPRGSSAAAQPGGARGGARVRGTLSGVHTSDPVHVGRHFCPPGAVT